MPILRRGSGIGPKCGGAEASGIMETLDRLIHDESGFVVTIELILIVTILVIGSIAGLAAVRDAVVSELSDVGGAIQDLNQSYSFAGVNGASASSAGSGFTDSTDFCDSPGDPANQIDNCISVFGISDEL